MKTHEELCKSGENPTIAELEDALATGKHVDLKPDGTATISDKKPRPTIDQALAEVGDKHNQPLSADMMGKACAAAARVLDAAEEKPLGDGDEIITNETIYRMVHAALMVVAYEKAQPAKHPTTPGNAALPKPQPFEFCPELTPWIERLANSAMPMSLIDWNAFIDAINAVAADASRYRSQIREENTGAFCIERDFEEWCALPNWLPVAKDGDGEYENESTRRFYACFEWAHKKGMWAAARKVNGELCDMVGKLSKQFWHPFSEQPPERGCYICRMKDGDSISYADLKFDDGWYGQGYRTITHWAEIPMLLWGK